MVREIKLHGIKCYNILARGIKHLAYSKELSKLAVLRNDFSIEIWNFTNAPFIERVIPGTIDCALEQVCWIDKRLFSISISGFGLIEWDLKTLSVKRKLMLTGDKGICIDYHKKTQRIAVGTEEGFINIFDVSDDDLQYVKILDRQDNRIVCCKFNESGDSIVSGSTDAVKIWSIKTGHVIHKMSTGRVDKFQETIVWCVQVLKDFTIITGDSRGRVTFWDGNIGTQIDWVQASNEDIMCLTVSEDQNSFFCSGVEQVVRKYVKITNTRDNQKFDQWIRNAKRYKLHTHDILTLTMISDYQIVSAGIDGFLSIASNELKIIERIGPFLKHPFAVTADEARLMLLMYTNYIEVWKLAEAKDEMEEKLLRQQSNEETDLEEDDDGILKPAVTNTTSQYYKMSVFPEKYLELRSKGDETVLCATISTNGKWIAYSTLTTMRLFHFDLENNKPQLIRIKNIPDDLSTCIQMKFSCDSNSLITVDSKRICKIFDLCSNELEHRQTIELNEYHNDIIHHLTISNCSKYLIFASLYNNVSVWTLKKKKYTHVKNLPKHICPATALKLHNSKPYLLVAYANNRIIEFNLEELYIQFSPYLAEDSSRHAILDICIDPENPDAIIFSQKNSINIIKRGDGENDAKKSVKKKKLQTDEEKLKYTHRIVKKFDTYLIHLEWLGESELLALEMNPVSLMENLPAPLRRKVFGTM
ncbi:hypothetical protein PVAND_009956 [Polypedilum vanderplanki]|uniref:WD repeat-containing protein 55 homolog n=1 Tax=Polypedilum vanderplanki TaxID=319348 RepID=A0A9J6CF65_POLVA|nr:hypothetical protein PVAND_009956 [Polypedilum vanderplanki]